MFKINTTTIKQTYRPIIAFLLSLILIFTSLPIQIRAEESETLPVSIPKRFFSLGILNMDLYTKGYAKKNGIYKSTESHAGSESTYKELKQVYQERDGDEEGRIREYL